MTLTIVSLLDVVDRLGWRGGRTDLLTYPEYVIFKGIDTLIDKKRIRLGLKLNVDAPLFNPQTFTKEIEGLNNNNLNHDMKQTSTTRDIRKEINQSIAQNEILKEYQHNTKLPRDDDLWIRVKNKIRKKANKTEVKLSHHSKNLYQPLATDDLEENTDESSCKSDDTPRVSNVKTQVKSKENSGNNRNIKRTTIEIINMMIQEYLADEKAELREINRLSLNIATKLTFHYQYNLENWNNQLGK